MCYTLDDTFEEMYSGGSSDWISLRRTRYCSGSGCSRQPQARRSQLLPGRIWSLATVWTRHWSSGSPLDCPDETWTATSTSGTETARSSSSQTGLGKETCSLTSGWRRRALPRSPRESCPTFSPGLVVTVWLRSNWSNRTRSYSILINLGHSSPLSFLLINLYPDSRNKEFLFTR